MSNESADEAGRYRPEINDHSMELLKRLRKKQIDFAPIDKYVKSIAALAKERPVDFTELAADKLTLFPDPTTTASATRLTGFAIERRKMLTSADFRNKLYLAPLTTVGNLPFRRVCVGFGAEITCGEMALATSLLQGSRSEWSLVRRHESEKIFGVQIAGGYADTIARTVYTLAQNVECDFIDLNMGCPIDLVCAKGAGCAMMQSVPSEYWFQSKRNHVAGLKQIVAAAGAACRSAQLPLTLKMRMGYTDAKPTALHVLDELRHAPIQLYTVHGRSRCV